ncbi:MAG: DUF6268 family outer membrane beta-barrel protein [Desulfovibrio sp.]
MRISKIPLLTVITITTLFCFSLSAHAGSTDIMKQLARIAEDIDFTKGQISTSGSFISSDSDSDGDTSVSQQTYDISADFRYLDFNYTHNAFDWKNTERLNFGNDRTTDPWDELHSLSVGARIPLQHNEQWSSLFMFDVSANYEDEIGADALEYGMGALAAYQYSENLKLQFGALVSIDPINVNFMPGLGLKYTYNEWEMALGIPETGVRYTMNDQWAFGTSFNSQSTLYNLSNDSSVISDGFAQVESSSLSLYADWTPTESITISAGPEYYFDRTMRIYDRDGNKKWNEEKTDNAFGGSINFTYAF